MDETSSCYPDGGICESHGSCCSGNCRKKFNFCNVVEEVVVGGAPGIPLEVGGGAPKVLEREEPVDECIDFIGEDNFLYLSRPSLEFEDYLDFECSDATVSPPPPPFPSAFPQCSNEFSPSPKGCV